MGGGGGGSGKRVDGVFSERSQNFRHQRRPVGYDHIMTAAQDDEREWRRTAENKNRNVSWRN